MNKYEGRNGVSHEQKQGQGSYLRAVGIFHLMKYVIYVSPQTFLANSPPVLLVQSHILLLPHMETGST